MGDQVDCTKNAIFKTIYYKWKKSNMFGWTLTYLSQLAMRYDKKENCIARKAVKKYLSSQNMIFVL